MPSACNWPAPTSNASTMCSMRSRSRIAPRSLPPPPLSGRIELRGVGFRYDPAAPWVLRDLSLTIEPGQKVALVGATGSGKSTLGRLLLGLFEPTTGGVLYDGVPLRQLDYV